MALLRKFLWLAVFVASTFFFVVVFEHGCCDGDTLTGGTRQELAALLDILRDPELEDPN